MNIGDEVFVTSMYEIEGDYNNDYKIRKKAQVLKIPGHIIEIDKNDTNSIRYQFGSAIHGGEIGFDCFLTKQEAENRVEGLNIYFKQNNCLIEEL
ncbi:hypothetical protein [Desulforamulus aeronauticus]|uniref:Uncharacterized protein n=1 Tax=Desulforamulus aeronauticus DSM 10349 TaxID=1121421 RepID=A0A1M6SAX0_9FIRM|nr:hypothetical protein [Desulforamulus aeronauticus]SHK41851.1 hypothetical protein SAMN02745123_01775 [Desulforamulus aeronauticus DSM 10349]